MLTAAQIRVLKEQDLRFSSSRSGGKGGQHVNKVESKVQVELDIARAVSLTEAQKATLLEKPSRHLSDGVLQFSCAEDRSQHRNREKAFEKLIAYLQSRLRIRKKRIPTKASKASQVAKRRMKEKQKEKKQLRRAFKNGN